MSDNELKVEFLFINGGDSAECRWEEDLKFIIDKLDKLLFWLLKVSDVLVYELEFSPGKIDPMFNRFGLLWGD